MSKSTLEEQVAQLQKQLANQKKINQVLMDRVERSVNDAADSYSLFERNLALQKSVVSRTRELELLNQRLQVSIEHANQAQAEAEQASRAKSNFLANMSHELRTPMNAIIGMANLAKVSATDPKLLERLGIIQQSSEHLLQIINNILDISKIEAERLELENVTFTLDLVLNKVSNLIALKAEEKGLLLEVVPLGDIQHLLLLGDPLRLSQILINFASNAVKFTKHGKVTISASILEETEHDVLLHLQVQDTGIGIAPENQSRLFTNFEQADSSTTRCYGGTGLGLSICKHLAQLMQGDVGVQSAHNQGSAFWANVRIKKTEKLIVEEPSLHPEEIRQQLIDRFSGAHILLVEDDFVNQMVATDFLEQVGLQVDTADNGRIALKAVQQDRYDLILMDMQMPEMNGLDATQEIRKLGFTMPILAMTANTFTEDAQACLSAGMNAHLGKPVVDHVLYQALLKWLDWQQRLSNTLNIAE